VRDSPLDRRPHREGAYMIAIVISACLVSDPNVCKDYRIPLSLDVNPRRCMMDAQPHFASWANQHPGWHIVRWRCASGEEQDL
jgi:hypothetical protein